MSPQLVIKSIPDIYYAHIYRYIVIEKKYERHTFSTFIKHLLALFFMIKGCNRTINCFFYPRKTT